MFDYKKLIGKTFSIPDTGNIETVASIDYIVNNMFDVVFCKYDLISSKLIYIEWEASEDGLKFLKTDIDRYLVSEQEYIRTIF